MRFCVMTHRTCTVCKISASNPLKRREVLLLTVFWPFTVNQLVLEFDHDRSPLHLYALTRWSLNYFLDRRGGRWTAPKWAPCCTLVLWNLSFVLIYCVPIIVARIHSGERNMFITHLSFSTNICDLTYPIDRLMPTKRRFPLS